MLLGDRDITGTYVLKISELSLKIFLQIRFLATVYGHLDLSQSGLAVEIGYSFGTFDVFVIMSIPIISFIRLWILTSILALATLALTLDSVAGEKLHEQREKMQHDAITAAARRFTIAFLFITDLLYYL